MSDFVTATSVTELLKDKARVDWLEQFMQNADVLTIQNFVQGLRAYTVKRESPFHPTVRELLDSIMVDESFY